jgi:3-deoxy-manno-octulosonate cytidylyltransferase (CMP-KDO synthetase)
MKKVAIIPARYSSSRFPGKPLANICGYPMIYWVYNQVKKVDEIDEVYVATDDIRIRDAVASFGGHAVMTSEKHSCGTDRIAECANTIELDNNDIVLNIQGDEPLIEPDMIHLLIKTLSDENDVMGTIKKRITEDEELSNPNVVKVVCDVNDYAIYFSRYCIPYIRDDAAVNYYKHIGAYAYRKWYLDEFCSFAKTPLEKSESLEQLRTLENGYRIKVLETDSQTVGVDTPEQLIKVEEIMKGR